MEPEKTINIEVKYPSSANLDVGQRYWSRAVVVREILRELDAHPRKSVCFSSFDPLVVCLLRSLQNIYPVLFLNDGRPQEGTCPPDVPFYFKVCGDFRSGCAFARNANLVGVVTSMAMVREHGDWCAAGVASGLELVTWGEVPGDVGDWEARQRELGVRILIYDLVHLFGGE